MFEGRDPKPGHSHTHGAIDPALFTTERGIRAVKWSLVALLATGIVQLVITLATGSIALLADTIHNFGDASTAIPLWFAFRLALRKPTPRFTYGYGRAEDLAGLAIVVIILCSAIFAGYESIRRFIHPAAVEHLPAVIGGAVVGFLGNEAVARFRIRVGQEIGSAALIADGRHARADGLVSLAVLIGAIGVGLGYPLADPGVGFLISLAILRIVWESGKSVLSRLLDGVDPEVIEEIKRTVKSIPEVQELSEVRVRWLGHRLRAEVNVSIDAKLTVDEGHRIAGMVHHELMHHLPYLSQATIHVDPAGASGERHHRFQEHTHDDLPAHSH
jgi:cation diffusion facilitator family transporter